MKRLLIALTFFSLTVVASAGVLEWSRFRGTVKALDYKKRLVTLEDSNKDYLTVSVDDDVTVMVGKDERPLKDIRLDDKITLLHLPKDKAEPPKEETFDDMNRKNGGLK